MTMTARLRQLTLLSAFMLLGGCVTNRSYISLHPPVTQTTAPSATPKIAVIGEIRDQRQFELKPQDPSIPSLKKGAAYRLDAQERLQAVARKRNAYGKALGDIMLTPPDSVLTIVRQLVTDGLRKQGYLVAEPGAVAPDDALRVDVDIARFWAWATPGFWTMDMEARIGTVLTFSGARSGTLEVDGYGKKTAPSAREGNWQQAYDRAFQDYLDKQQAALPPAGSTH